MSGSMQINMKTGNITDASASWYSRPTSEYNEDVKDVNYIIDTWSLTDEEKQKLNTINNNNLKGRSY